MVLVLLSAVSAKKKDASIPSGQVKLSDGSFPELLVTIEQICNGVVKMAGFSGPEGRFTVDDSDSTGCEVRAYLPGYRSRSVALPGPDLGTIVLEPRGKKDSAARSTKTKEFNKSARKAYEKGLDDAAKGKWRAAEDEFQMTIKLFGGASSAWLSLGMVQEREGDAIAAKHSYKQAIGVEAGFALPYFQAAAIEVSRGEWEEALSDSNKIIELDAESFPGAYLMNAWANLNTHHMDVAETRAREGIKLDTEHRFPELEYVLGLVLIDKVDGPGAIEHLKSYLALDPKGARAAAARAELTRLEQPKQSTP